MPNEKIVNRDNLKAFRQELDKRYAKPDGYYPTMTVGLADNFTPYSEDSDAEQDNPFISNGTGTNNNTEIVTVGDYGLLQEKQGNSVVVNQLRTTYRTYADTDNHITTTPTQDGKSVRIVSDGQRETASNTWLANTSGKLISGHKYLILTDKKEFPTGLLLGCNYSYNDTKPHVFEATENVNNPTISFYISANSTFDVTLTIYLIDLTQWGFSDDEIADLTAHPEHFSWYYNGDLSYNTGTLVNADGNKLVSTGRNLFNKDTVELNKYINHSNGTLASSNDFVATDFIEITPNSQLYLSIIGTSDYNEWGACYDKDKNFISSYDMRVNGITSGQNIVPSNARFIRVSIPKAYYEQATISLYYTPEQGGEGYSNYYPYEAPYEVDTGSEVLRSVGSVCDYKEPNGTIHRVVGYVDLGTLNWNYQSSSGNMYADNAIINRKANGSSLLAKYTRIYNSVNKDLTGVGDLTVNNGYAFQQNLLERIIIRDTSYTDATTFKTAMSGVYLFYELAEETTETGTPFAENLPINDYGMLYWLDENDELVGIPQGAKIFYPTNYKGFVDDMYSRVDGDSSQYVIQSELNVEDSKVNNLYAIMQENVGGSLRHQLANANSLDFNNTAWVDLGNFTSWTYSATTGFNTGGGAGFIKAETANMLCAYYKGINNWNLYIASDKVMFRASSGVLFIKDSSYSDATAFKNHIKGIILAYEKA